MAINQINSADFNYATMLATINAAYVGQDTITITNLDDDTAPQVTAGAIFENNGALFENTVLATPTGYAGMTNSTTFYLYYDESGGVFIFSNTAPTWSDAKQGWYNGNDRAFFAMYKDSGGTLYQNKHILKGSNPQTMNMRIGIWDMDTDGTKNIDHGLNVWSIVSATGVILRDTDVAGFAYIITDNGLVALGATVQITMLISETQVQLARWATGDFDSVLFDSNDNRGFIELKYNL